MRLLSLVGILLGAAMASAAAQDMGPEVKPLTGTYYMSPQIYAEDPNAPADHVNMHLTGDAAKALWDAMKVEADPEACLERMTKRVESLVCYGPPTPSGVALGPDESPFECDIGIDLKTASIVINQDC